MRLAAFPRLAGLVQRLALAVLPEPVLYRLLHLYVRRTPRPTLDTARDDRIVVPQAGLELHVYWSDVPGVGAGPSASLFVAREEVIRFDCFGGGDGHMHLNPQQAMLASGPPAPRLYFPRGSREDHVARAVFEIVANASAAMKTNRLRRVREFPLDDRCLEVAAREMATHMAELMERYGRAREQRMGAQTT